MEQRGNAADVGAIVASDDAWIRAFNAGDLDTVASLYTSDAIVMPPGEAELRGRGAIRDWMRRFLEQHDARQTLVHDEVVVAGDWAFMRGHFELTVHSREGDERRQRGKHLVIWQRQASDGRWLAARDIWNLE